MSLFLTNSGASLVLATGGIPVTTGLTTPLADGVHPRLLMAPDGYTNVETPTSIRAKMAADVTVTNGYISYFDTTVYGSSSGNDKALNFGFLYQISAGGTIAGCNAFGHSQAQYGAEALRMIRTQIASGSVGGYYDAGGSGGIQTVLAADLIWPLLTIEDKTTLYAWCAALDESQIHETFNSQGAGQASSGLVSRLCLYGSGVGESAWTGDLEDLDAMFQARFRADYSTGMQDGGFSKTNSDYGGTDGGFCQGLLYGLSYTMSEITLAEDAYRTCKGLSKESHYGTSTTAVMEYFPRWVLHQLLPDAYPRTYNANYANGYPWIFWKGEKVSWPNGTTTNQYRVARELESITGLYKDVNASMAGLARWILNERTSFVYVAGVNTLYMTTCIPQRWIYGDPSVAAVSPVTSGEPVSKYHHRGWLTSRLTWDATIDEPWVSVSVQNYYCGGHSMIWPGNINIHRQGPVMWTRGDNEGHGYIGSPHAASGMNFPNRLLNYTTVVKGEDNYGSMRRHVNSGGNITPYLWLESRIADMAGTRRVSVASGDRTVDYVLADLSRTYSSSATNCRDYYDATGRIDSAIREVVYFKPATESGIMRLFCYDTYTFINKKYRPEVWWNCATAPTFSDGSTSAGPSMGATETHGKTQSTDATSLTWDNGNSVAYLTKILPASSYRIITVGGASSGGDRYDGTEPSAPTGSATDSHEQEDAYGLNRYEPWGAHANKNPASELLPYYGWGNIRIVDESQAVSDTSGTYTGSQLTVIEVNDTGQSKSTTLTLAGASSCVGAISGTAVAVFATGGISQTSLAFRLETAGTYTVHISRLNPSASRSFAFGANITSINGDASSPASATASAAGEVLLTIVVGSNGTSTDNTITVS